MNPESRVSVRWSVLGAAALGLLAIGAAATYVAVRPDVTPSSASDAHGGMPMGAPTAGMPSADASAMSNADRSADMPQSMAMADVAITLTPEAIDRAGITVATVGSGTTSATLQAPGTVEPNAYKQVVVTPLVSGRVTSVTAELGQQVTRNQTIAQVYSPELAEAQTRYVSARAELEAHEQELARTEKLVKIGAASQEELEQTHAMHTAHRAGVQSAASRLRLLGLSTKTIEGLGPDRSVSATTSVPAPMSGVVTERMANVGLNVDQATPLFTVVDLSSVWVVAEVYERDFARVRVGMPATITTSAYPDRVLEGRVSYIDPQVSAETRTAKVRIEVPNRGGDLRLGMYAMARLGGGSGGVGSGAGTRASAGEQAMPTVPRSAVQNVADRTMVYLAAAAKPGTFIEREVRLGAPIGDVVPVLSGVQAGDVVVVEGSFYLRAERERLGLRRATSPATDARPSTEPRPRSSSTSPGQSLQTAKVVVGAAGFAPESVTLRAGVPARLTFVRTSAETCGTEVTFPSLQITRSLPLDIPVTIEFTPAESGDIAFSCGMGMLKGNVVVQAQR